MSHRFTDAVPVSGTRKTADGYLVAEAFAVRSGVQIYSGAELGMADREVVRVYRSEDEVRSPESMKTFGHAPVTLGHPERVTAENWKDLAKGEVSTDAEWDGNKIKLPLILKDAEAISAIEAGTRELSAGYTCSLDFAGGTTPDGEQYDAAQKDIRINHIAIVPRGRAGSECRIGDDADNWGAAPITETSGHKETIMPDALKTVVLGDKAAQVAVADASIIEQFKTDQAKALSDAEAKHASEIEAKDTEIATKDAEIDGLKKEQLSDADLDKRVQGRADLVGTARSIVKDIEVKGLSDAEIRKAVVKSALGDTAVTDKSDSYVEARFDILAESAGKEPDTLGDAARGGVQSPITNDGWDKVANLKKEA